jgi:ubiquitin carboxyl-terminal hydrolase 7
MALLITRPDITLRVKGMKSLYDSLRDLVTTKTVDANQGDGGRQPSAQQGVNFHTFPPVLHLHLKRFEDQDGSVLYVGLCMCAR